MGNLGEVISYIATFLPLGVFAVLLIFMMRRAGTGSRPTAMLPDKYDQLRKIAELRDRGVLSEQEFQHEKQKLLASDELIQGP